jgi:tetratricopeptide (TPR) repeat protein
MKYCFALAALALAPLAAASDPKLDLAAKALSAFDSVQLAAIPRIEQTGACVQAQAEALSVAAPEDAAFIHYRKGYCALTGAALIHGAAEFRAAAADFDKAIEAWPDRTRAATKKNPAEPIPSGLRALPWIARLAAGADESMMKRARNELGVALMARSCVSTLMTASFCDETLETARVWLGWIALENGDLYEANSYLSAARDAGWRSWAAGRQAFQDGRYAGAVSAYRQALGAWAQARQEPAPPLTQRLAPRPDTAEALGELGAAVILAGDAAGAIPTLDAAIKANPENARAFYLRAQARQALGQTQTAMADYSLASRAAFAASTDLASGEAHLYRGIAFYLGKDYTRAEDEFSSALNFDVPERLKPDAEAWRDLAAVAGGACAETPARLKRDLETASPFFPKQDARRRAFSCDEERTVAASAPGAAQ